MVGLNCIRGPRTMLPLLAATSARRATAHIAALPVPYRTTEAEPTSSRSPIPVRLIPGGRPFPTALDPFTCNRYELGEFARPRPTSA